MIPTALQIAARQAIHKDLLRALQRLRDCLARKAQECDDVVKVGRTHLMDAAPVRLGEEFARHARQIEPGISQVTGLEDREAADHFEAQGARDVAVQTSGALKTLAVSLYEIANDIRLLGSGPRCGLGELVLPPRQVGSSMFPARSIP